MKKILQDDKTLKLVNECKANPEAFEENEEEEEEQDEKSQKSDEEDDNLPSAANEDVEWDMSSTSSSSSSSDEDDNVVYTSKRDKWTLKPKDLEKMKKEDNKKNLPAIGNEKQKEKRKEEKVTSNYEYGMKELIINTIEELIETYCKTMENRGKKVNKVEQIMILTQLYNESQKYEDYYKIMTGLGLITVIVLYIYIYYCNRLNFTKILIHIYLFTYGEEQLEYYLHY